jgi:hypothetical protein
MLRPFGARPGWPDLPQGPVTVGVDIGSRADYTAVAVAEILEPLRPVGRLKPGDCVYVLRTIKRLPLRTSYEAIVAEVGRIAEVIHQRGQVFVGRIVCDATGQGLPLVERFAQAVRPGEWTVHAVTITGALTALKPTDGLNRWTLAPVERRPPGPGQMPAYLRALAERIEPVTEPAPARIVERNVGKGYLVSRLRALMAFDRLQVPGPLGRALADELLAFEMRQEEDTGREVYGARVGSHDDLVLAAALACVDEPARREATTRRLNVRARRPTDQSRR